MFGFLNGLGMKFDAPYVLVQPYDGKHAPPPVSDRQVRLTLTCQVSSARAQERALPSRVALVVSGPRRYRSRT